MPTSTVKGGMVMVHIQGLCTNVIGSKPASVAYFLVKYPVKGSPFPLTSTHFA